MRISASCVLLAYLAATLAAPETPRSKRHLQQWKDAILSKFFGNTAPKEENARFFRIPGHNNILVKAVPKIDTIETAVVAPEKLEDASPTIAILKTYLGTKSASETLSALQGVKHLLQSGILSVRNEPPIVVPYEKSAFLVPPFVPERIEFVQPTPAAVISGPPKIPLIPVLPPAAEAPQVIEEIIPVKAIPTRVPDPVPYPKFTYKQMKKDGSVVTYTVQDDISSDVVVTETNKSMPRPPSFIVDRLRKVFLRLPLGAQTVPVQLLPPLPSSIPLNPSFDVYSVSAIPPIHTKINVPKGEVQFQTYPTSKVHIDDKLDSFTDSVEVKGTNVKIVAEEPALLMQPPSTFIVDRIKNAAAISATESKAKKPTGFQIVNKEDYITEQEIFRNPGHVVYNSQPFASPMTSENIYRQSIPFISNPLNAVNVGNNPAYVSKGNVIVKVNKNHAGTSKPNVYHHQQFQSGFDSKFSSDGWRGTRPIALVTNSVMQMPVPPAYIIERIQNFAAKAHSMPKISRGYAFKINNQPFTNSNNKSFTEKPTTNEIGTKITRPSITKDKENLGAVYFAEPVPSSYIYKQITQSIPQPFRVMQVEDKTTYKPAGPVTIYHEHARPDGTMYKCKESHHMEVQFPKDFYYVPPVTTAEMDLPTTHKIEKLDDVKSQFSYVQLTNNGVYTNKDDITIFNDDKHSNVLSSSVNVKVTSGKKLPKNPQTLSDNPIVVPDTTYSFPQTHIDGSATKDYGDSVKSVTTKLSEGRKTNPRGDIPEAFE